MMGWPVSSGALRSEEASASEVYEGSKAHYRFRCEAGHEFDMLGARTFRGSWCVECQHESKRYGMSLMHEVAKAHGGRCLSGIYRNAATRLEWECARGHRWWAYPGAIVRGHWCSACAHDAGKLGIDLMRAIAKERGGSASRRLTSTVQPGWNGNARAATAGSPRRTRSVVGIGARAATSSALRRPRRPEKAAT